MRTDVYVGIGSNLNDPLRQVKTAVDRMGAIPNTCVRAVSSLYQTAPIGQPGQDDYINAVALLQTELEPEALLDELQLIEHKQGRVRDGTRWGSRTLDLDILLFGEQCINTDRLTIPHPEMTKRAFVLEPLSELVPDNFIVPGSGNFDVVRSLPDSTGVRILEENGSG